jgi:hypothetical protein
MNISHCVGALCLGILPVVSALAAPPFPGAKPAGETRSEKFLLPVQIKHADLAGEGAGVQAKIILPARMRGLPPPAGAPANVGATESAPPRSLGAVVAMSLAAMCAVWVVRGQSLHITTKAAVLGIAVLAAGYGAVQAQGPSANAKPEPERGAKDKIVVEFSVDVEEAVLILPAK